MKVRHKQGGAAYTVIDQSVDYYIGTADENMTVQALPKKWWEPIPSETWRDVTGECEWSNWSGKMMHKADNGENSWWVEPESGYRLRKVQLFNEDIACMNVKQWAFIVEKREQK